MVGPRLKCIRRVIPAAKANLPASILTIFIGGTDVENEADKIEHGTNTVGRRNGMSKMTEAKVVSALRLIDKGRSNRVIADKFGVDLATIRRIRNGTSWTHVER